MVIVPPEQKKKKKRKPTSWFEALEQQGLEIKSARDAMQVKGWLDTGNFALNWAISGQLLGGYPLGHTVEIFGDPATGKSYLIARAVAMAQRAGGAVLLDDTEGGYNKEHAERIGVDLDALAHYRSRTVKEHLKVAQAFVEAYRAVHTAADVPGVLAVDSLAALSTEHELEVQLDKRDMTKAQELHAFFRIMGSELLELPIVHLSANHAIATIGMFQSRTTPGGGGPKYAASVRLDLRAISKIKSGADYAGAICRVVVNKNRIVAPWKEVRLAIPFAQPISRASGLVPLLVAMGVLEERGQFLLRAGQRLGRAYKTKEKFLDQDEIGERLLEQYPDILEEADAALGAGVLGEEPIEESTDVSEDEDNGSEEHGAGGTGED